MVDTVVRNESIQSNFVILINSDGENLGQTSTQEALQNAKNQNLDLVVVSDNSDIPVCKVMDYGKFNYNRKQKQRKQHKQSSNQKVKEMRFSVFTDDHDVQVKSNKINKFLGKGHKVKLMVRFPARQKETIKPTLEKLIERITSFIDVEYEMSEKDTINNSNYMTEISPKK